MNKVWNLVGPCHYESDIPGDFFNIKFIYFIIYNKIGQGELECSYITNPIVSSAISLSCEQTHLLWQSLGGCPNIAAVNKNIYINYIPNY